MNNNSNHITPLNGMYQHSYGYSYGPTTKVIKTTTVTEYDEQKRVVKETVTVEETSTTPQYQYYPNYPYITSGNGMSIPSEFTTTTETSA